MTEFLLPELHYMIFAVGKALGAPTGNATYDALKDLTGIASLGIIVLALMSPELHKRLGIGMKGMKLRRHYNKIIKLRDDLMKAIKIFEDELADRKNGIPGEGTEEQLEKEIIPELKRILACVNNYDIPEKSQRYFHSLENARAIWGWNMRNPTEICKLLIELDERYNCLLD